MESAVNPGRLYGAESMSRTLKEGRIWAPGEGTAEAKNLPERAVSWDSQGRAEGWGKLRQALAHHCQSLKTVKWRGPWTGHHVSPSTGGREAQSPGGNKWLTGVSTRIPERGCSAPSRFLGPSSAFSEASMGLVDCPRTPPTHCSFSAPVTAGLGQAHESSWAQAWSLARVSKEVEGCTGKDSESEVPGLES